MQVFKSIFGIEFDPGIIFMIKRLKKEDRVNILHRIRWEANNDISLLRFVKSLYRFLFFSKIYSYKGG